MHVLADHQNSDLTTYGTLHQKQRRLRQQPNGIYDIVNESSLSSVSNPEHSK